MTPVSRELKGLVIWQIVQDSRGNNKKTASSLPEGAWQKRGGAQMRLGRIGVMSPKSESQDERLDGSKKGKFG